MKPKNPRTYNTVLADMHAYREGHAQRFNFDLRRIFDDLLERQKTGKRNIVSFPPKRIDQNKRNAA